MAKTEALSGAYPAIHKEADRLPFGYAIVPTQELYDAFYLYNGFVIPTYNDAGDMVTSFAPNTEAWEAWKAAQADAPAPEPTAQERIEALEAAVLEMILGGAT